MGTLLHLSQHAQGQLQSGDWSLMSTASPKAWAGDLLVLNWASGKRDCTCGQDLQSEGQLLIQSVTEGPCAAVQHWSKAFGQGILGEEQWLRELLQQFVTAALSFGRLQCNLHDLQLQVRIELHRQQSQRLPTAL